MLTLMMIAASVGGVLGTQCVYEVTPIILKRRY